MPGQSANSGKTKASLKAKFKPTMGAASIDRLMTLWATLSIARNYQAETVLIFRRRNERADQPAVVAAIVHHVHPEVKPQSRIAMQIAEVPSLHERRVVLRLF
jgi:hypothetical protein